MSGANYEYCPVCDSKAYYVGDDDVVDIVMLHAACYDRRLAEKFQAGREEAIGLMLQALADTDRLIDEVVAAGTASNNGTKEFIAHLRLHLAAARGESEQG